MATGGAEVPQAWTAIEPSTELIDRINRVGSSGLPVLEPRDPLSVRQAGDVYFLGDPDAQAVTLLSWRITVPRLVAPRINADVGALKAGMQSISFRMRRYGGIVRYAGISAEDVVLGGELPSPAEILDRSAVLSSGESAAQSDSPQGLGFVVMQAMQPDELVLGWCEPWSGRSCAVPVDTASLRTAYPNLTLDLLASPGGGTGRF